MELRRFHLTLLLLAAVQCVAALGRPSAAQNPPRNVVLIVGDDHGRDAGCYGNADVATPHLDRLAREGTRFDLAFCTTPSCSPSRSVLLSGLQNHANGMYGLQHATHKQNSHPWVRGLPNLLRAAGYRTAICGKYHVAPEASYEFDAKLDQQTMGSRSTVRMAENAEQWLSQDRAKPFFLMMSYTDPHRAQKGFANDRTYPGVVERKYDPKALKVPFFLPDRPEVRAELAEYYQSVSRMDQGIGRLLEALEKTGHAANTLVVYLSDNGIPFPGAKTSMYDPGVRLPLIVRSPAQSRRGVVSRAMVSWTDITPTILDWAGAPGPAYPLHGRSFLKTLEQENPAGWDHVFGSHQFHEVTMYYPVRMLRTRTHKLLLNLAHPLEFPFASDLWESDTWQGVLQRRDRMYGERPVKDLLHRPRVELYDLEKDPKELRNVADDRFYDGIRRDLEARLKAWQEETKDPWAIKYRHE